MIRLVYLQAERYIAAQVKANEQVNQVYRIVKDSGNEQLLKQITTVLRKMEENNG